MLKPSLDTSKCGWFHRQFTDVDLVSEANNPVLLKYIDRTEKDKNGVNITKLQDNLKTEIKKALLGQNIVTYPVKWNVNGRCYELSV